MRKQEITARVIFEVVGSPKEFVEQTLKDTLKKLENDDQVRLQNAKTYETEQLENKFWSTFAEIEFKADSMKEVLDLCFDYTPSTLEILEPAGLELDTEHLANFMNDLLAKIHQFIAVIKNYEAENQVLKQKLEKNGK